MSDNVKVCVRIRPFLDDERIEGTPLSSIRYSNFNEVTIAHENTNTSYQFDRVFYGNKSNNPVSQTQFYKEIGSKVLQDAINGYNGCIMAYGQTGTGKSFTIFGKEMERGIIPLMIEELFKYRAELLAERVQIEIWISAIEIYGENVHDLLNVPSGKNDLNESHLSYKPQQEILRVVDHPVVGVYVPQLTEIATASQAEVVHLLSFIKKRRTVAITNVNAASSRSHAIFTIRLERINSTNDTDNTGLSTKRNVSKIYLIDLAGSERINTQSKSIESEYINRSIKILNSIVNQLTTLKEIPEFRVSKLSLMLKESLIGNCKTTFIGNIMPSAAMSQETISTLNFLKKCKNLRLHLIQNIGSHETIVSSLQEEIRKLQSYLNEAPLSEGYDITIALNDREEMICNLNKSYDNELQKTSGRISRIERYLNDLGYASDDCENDEIPYLCNISNDSNLMGCLQVRIPIGEEITIGSHDRNKLQIHGLGINDHICTLINGDNCEVQLKMTGEGKIEVNGEILKAGTPPINLSSKDHIVFGRAHKFRIIIPHEPPSSYRDEGSFVVNSPSYEQRRLESSSSSSYKLYRSSDVYNKITKKYIDQSILHQGINTGSNSPMQYSYSTLSRTENNHSKTNLNSSRWSHSRPVPKTHGTTATMLSQSYPNVSNSLVVDKDQITTYREINGYKSEGTPMGDRGLHVRGMEWISKHREEIPGTNYSEISGQHSSVPSSMIAWRHSNPNSTFNEDSQEIGRVPTLLPGQSTVHQMVQSDDRPLLGQETYNDYSKYLVSDSFQTPLKQRTGQSVQGIRVAEGRVETSVQETNHLNDRNMNSTRQCPLEFIPGSRMNLSSPDDDTGSQMRTILRVPNPTTRSLSPNFDTAMVTTRSMGQTPQETERSHQTEHTSRSIHQVERGIGSSPVDTHISSDMTHPLTSKMMQPPSYNPQSNPSLIPNSGGYGLRSPSPHAQSTTQLHLLGKSISSWTGNCSPSIPTNISLSEHQISQRFIHNESGDMHDPSLQRDGVCFNTLGNSRTSYYGRITHDSDHTQSLIHSMYDTDKGQSLSNTDQHHTITQFIDHGHHFYHPNNLHPIENDINLHPFLNKEISSDSSTMNYTTHVTNISRSGFRSMSPQLDKRSPTLLSQSLSPQLTTRNDGNISNDLSQNVSSHSSGLYGSIFLDHSLPDNRPILRNPLTGETILQDPLLLTQGRRRLTSLNSPTVGVRDIDSSVMSMTSALGKSLQPHHSVCAPVGVSASAPPARVMQIKEETQPFITKVMNEKDGSQGSISCPLPGVPLVSTTSAPLPMRRSRSWSPESSPRNTDRSVKDIKALLDEFRYLSVHKPQEIILDERSIFWDWGKKSDAVLDLQRFEKKLNYRNFQTLSEEQELLLDICHLIDEVKEITDQIRPEENFNFQIELLANWFDETIHPTIRIQNALCIRVTRKRIEQIMLHDEQNIDDGRLPQEQAQECLETLYFWTYNKFRERLEKMREVYHTHLHFTWYDKNTNADPWIEISSLDTLTTTIILEDPMKSRSNLEIKIPELNAPTSPYQKGMKVHYDDQNHQLVAEAKEIVRYHTSGRCPTRKEINSSNCKKKKAPGISPASQKFTRRTLLDRYNDKRQAQRAEDARKCIIVPKAKSRVEQNKIHKAKLDMVAGVSPNDEDLKNMKRSQTEWLVVSLREQLKDKDGIIRLQKNHLERKMGINPEL